MGYRSYDLGETMSDRERSLAKCSGFDFGIEDHGFSVLLGSFEYDTWGVQGLGYSVDVDFLKRFMAVFNVTRLGSVNGKSCWVTHNSSQIFKIEPLHKKDGTPFDIEAWAEEKRQESTSKLR